MYWYLFFSEWVQRVLQKREESASVRYVALSDLPELQRVESVKFALNAKDTKNNASRV